MDPDALARLVDLAEARAAATSAHVAAADRPPLTRRPISERLRDRCYRCDGTRRIETRTLFPATKYGAAVVVIGSAPCPRCAHPA